MNTFKKKKVAILGTEYSVSYLKKVKYCREYGCDGYTDGVAKVIKVQMSESPEYDKKVMRHELIHGFLFESGLAGGQHVRPADETHDEQQVDWMAVMLPKIVKICEELECI